MQTLGDVAAKSALAVRIRALRPDSQRQWGRMTPHQALCHLSDSFRACMGQKAISRAPSLPLQGSIMKFFALHVPMKWPKGIPTRPEVEQGKGGTIPVEFEADRQHLLNLIEQFAAARSRTPHPIFGEMKEWEWLRWGWLHVDHHLRQFGA